MIDNYIMDQSPRITMTLSEILANTPPVQTLAQATDVPGTNLEWMKTAAYPTGAWFGDLGELSATVFRDGLFTGYLALGVTCKVSGVPYSWGGTGWDGGRMSGQWWESDLIQPSVTGTLAELLATTPDVGTIGIPSDATGSAMQYGALGWDGHFGTIQGGFPAVLALPTGHVALGASIECARAGWRRFSWAGSDWTLGDVGSTQLVAYGPPQLFWQSQNNAGSEVVAGKTYKVQVTAIPKSWDVVRGVFINRSNNSTVTINKAMVIVGAAVGNFNSTSNTRAFLKFNGNFNVGPIAKATQADNVYSQLPTFVASDPLPFPQELTNPNQLIEIRAYHDPDSGNNGNPLIQAQDAQLGPYSYANAAGDRITVFGAISGVAGYYSPMFLPVFYKWQTSVPASAIVFGDSIAQGQTTTNGWQSLVNTTLRGLNIPHMSIPCYGQTSSGTLAVMRLVLPFLASIGALPTHAIIWAYSPNDRLANGSNGSTSSTSWAIFQQKLALLMKFGVTPICIGPVPDAGLTTLKPLGDLLVSDYGGYSPFMDNSVDGVNWIAANTNDNLHPNDTGVAASITAGFQTWLASKLV